LTPADEEREQEEEEEERGIPVLRSFLNFLYPVYSITHEARPPGNNGGSLKTQQRVLFGDWNGIADRAVVAAGIFK